MKTSLLDPDLHRTTSRLSWLDRPLSGWWCALGWLVATMVFGVLVRLLGGPTPADSAESVYSTYAIAHGHLACAYAQQTPAGSAFIAPLWPLVSGGFSVIFRIGHNLPFPSQTALGPHCSTALTAMTKWATRSGATQPTIRIGYLSWLVLMFGAVALLRASGRGRCGWEPTALVLMACVPAVFMTLVQYFHPQDIVAMGLLLGGVACCRRGWWVWAGILFGLAATSQQFALLVLVSLLVVAPSNRRIRFAGAAIGAFALVVVPLLVVTSGRAFRSVVIGSGNTPSVGGTVLWEAHFHGAPLVALSRILPIILSLALGWVAVRSLGSRVLEPAPLLALVATSLSLRLVFEQNLFGYYFMALAAALVMLDVVRGRIRWHFVLWLLLVTLAFPPASSETKFREVLPIICMTIAILFIVLDAMHGRIRLYLVAWLVLVVLAFAKVPPWVVTPVRNPLPTWFWQIVLTTSGVAMAGGPIVSLMRKRNRSESQRHPIALIEEPDPVG
jgi:Glycosyltransferase family 87